MPKISNAEVRAIARSQRQQRERRNIAAMHDMVGAPVRPHELSPTERAIFALIGR